MKAEELRSMPLLFDFYGGLLSERQRELCECYYNNDLSLSEIAADLGITRQGVRDGLKKAEAILSEAEATLGFLALWQARCETVKEIETRLHALGVSDEELLKKLETLRQ